MKVVEQNEGTKISYDLMGNVLILNQELYLNLAAYERDFDVEIDISRNEYGMITMGLSRAYVAQIHIPAREYIETEVESAEEGEEAVEREAVPFNIDNVTLTLWGDIN